MITTTTSTIPNIEITEILSVVHNRVVLGTNLFSDISAGFSDIFGGKNTAYEKKNEVTLYTNLYYTEFNFCSKY